MKPKIDYQNFFMQVYKNEKLEILNLCKEDLIDLFPQS